MKYLMKEGFLLSVFIIMGGLWIVSWWLKGEVNESILRQYKESHISLVMDDTEGLRAWLTRAPGVLSYKLFDRSDNKEKLQDSYPELSDTLNSIDNEFFPSSALVSVSNVDAFMKALSRSGLAVESRMIHQPPVFFVMVINVLAYIFSFLWLGVLGLMLFASIERTTILQQQQWSLMKMLGARAYQVFLPLVKDQVLRVGVSAIVSVIVAQILIKTVLSPLVEIDRGLNFVLRFGFVFGSVALTLALSYSLFYFRYKRVPLG